MIEILIVRNPFEPHFKERQEVVYMDGLSVKDYYPRGDIYIVNGEYLTHPENRIPDDGTQIVVTTAVGGGDFGKILGFVASIALMAYAGNIAGGLWSTGTNSFFAAGHLGAFLASGAVMMIGGRLINGIFPQQVPNLDYKVEEKSQSYGWEIPAPSYAEGNVIGVTFGECIPQPQVLTQHVETVNGKQYLNLLLCGGEGPVDGIRNIRIGNNDIGNYSDVQLEYRLGTNNQGPVPFFGDTPIDQSVDLELGDNALIQTTNSTKARDIEITMSWPGGLYHINDDGGYGGTTVEFAVAYRKKGEKLWNGAGKPYISCSTGSISGVEAYQDAACETWTITQVNLYPQRAMVYWNVCGSISGQAEPAYLRQNYDNGKIKFCITDGFRSATISVQTGTYRESAAQSAALVRSYKFGGLPPAQYEVKVQLISRDKSSRTSSITRWAMMTSYDSGLYSRPGKVLVAMRILATNQLSGGVPSVNWRQYRNTVWVWNPSSGAYEARAASNPIWAAYDIMHYCRRLENINTGGLEYHVFGIAKERFTKYWDQWTEAAAYADELVTNPDGTTEKRFQFDAFFDTTQKRITAAQKAATVGHAVILSHGDDIGIVVDKPGSITQIFGEGRTTLSSVQGTFSSADERARAIEITYNEQNNDFKNTKFVTRSTLFTAADQDNTAQVTLFGVARRTQAWREAIRALAKNERECQTLEFSADVDAMVSEYGDIIGWNHKVSQIGLASGRLTAVSAGSVTLDKEVTLETGKTYELDIQRYDDKLIKKTVAGNGKTTAELTLSVAFSADELPQTYDVYCLGETEKAVKPFRIVSIGRDEDLKCSIKCLEYDAAVYSDSLDYSKYPIKDYTSASGLIDVSGLSVAENTYMQRDGIAVSDISVSWTLARRLSADLFIVSISTGDSWSEYQRTMEMTCNIMRVNTLCTYYVRVQTIADGTISRGVIRSVYITGKDMPPHNVARFDVVQSGPVMVAIIDEVRDTDIAYYEIRQGMSWGKSVLVGTFIGTKYEFAATDEGTMTYWVKARDTSGNYSDHAAKAICNVAGLPERNVIYKHSTTCNDWKLTGMWADVRGYCRICGKKVLADYEKFADIFGGLHELRTDAELVLPPIDLGENMLDMSCFWKDTSGQLHLKSTKTLADYEKFADIFGGSHEYMKMKYQNSTFSAVDVDYELDGNAKYTVEYRTSIDATMWSEWIPESVKQFAGRYIQVRILPKSIDGIGNIVIKGVTVTIDVPDMEDIIENVRLNAAAATTIHFNKKFKEIKSFSAYTDLAGRQVTCVLENRTESSIDVSALDDNGNRIAATLQKLVIRGY